MASILTEHVRHFGTPAADNGFLPVVQRILRCLLRRRGLSSRAPSQLGYPHVRSWRDEAAFDDITQDCYLSAVVRRIPGLKRALRPNRDIDPLIIRNMGHFLAERQREHNPIGYAVFQNVRAAVLRARQASWLTLERRQRCPVSDSLIRFAGAAGAPASIDWLTTWFESLTDRKRAGFALSSCSQEAQDWLFDRLQDLGEAVSGPMRLGDLVAVLERQARSAWAASAPPPSLTAVEVSGDEESALVRVVLPDLSVDDRDHFRSLIARTEQALGELPQRQGLRERRLGVLNAVVQHFEQTGGTALHQAELAQVLGIHQVTLCRDLQLIGDILQRLSAEMK